MAAVVTNAMPPDIPFFELVEPVCRQILYESIGDSGARWWDLAILIPNCIFLIFLGYGLKVAIRKLRASSSPIFTAFYGLIVAVCIISVLRCVVAMTVNATTSAGDITDKVLWLILRFALLATEMSVVIFGLAFGHLDSRTSIQRVLIVTFTIALLYSSIQGTLELVYEHPEFTGKSGPATSNSTTYVSYDLFAHGGMIFLLTTSLLFALVYTVIVILPFTNLRERFRLPTKPAFYYYCVFLAVLNFSEAVASLLLYLNVQNSLCAIDVTTYLYFSFYHPLVYIVFLWNFFIGSSANVHFSYKHHLGEDDASSSGAAVGLEDDQMSLPTNGVFRSKGGDGDIGDLSPFYSIDSTHLDFNFIQENNDRRRTPTNDSSNTHSVSINGDLYGQVVDT
ncbi:transmembrane protein adipocyte-associated 1 homolog [Plakobranchus ocellatus]|uniref:Transmembrane protein adipocyte-associated 1 homolog n=1 Tax=Plakobranchus ocellatus TaxID=259542 RepID=A0AAV3Z5V5_9GAST|nr:transmembrane protein adipocyte-associated 1 homolog [Plakobranchus ocellatus]